MIRDECPPGYRMHIPGRDEGDPSGSNPHFSGGTLQGHVREISCPNCDKLLFPVFQLSLSDKRVRDLGLWGREFLQVLVCPSCALYMEPYWILFRDSSVEILGGERDGGDILNSINTSYESRGIILEPLVAEDYPLTEQSLEAIVKRQRPPGVYHQIGGLPHRGDYDEMSCHSCGQLMRFAGIVDYDDLNVPLYENDHEPVALIIGDMNWLHYFTCAKCSAIGIKWKI
jgi:hypothetical protein